MKYIFNKVVKQYLRYRYKRIERMRQMPTDVQDASLHKLIYRSRNTEVGREFNFSDTASKKEYARRLPIVSYENIVADIKKMMNGESDVLCPGRTEMFAKSSGTTDDRSKYLPLPSYMHKHNHVAASWDTMSIVYHNDPSAQIFEKKSTIMGGSLKSKGLAKVGDVSAILLDKMHWAGRPFFTPDFETATMSDWVEKLEKMARVCANDPVVMLGGVPSWTLLLCERILELTGKDNMLDVWPTAKYYMHGGIGFEPYRSQFERLFPSHEFKYYEIYNASEGFFAVQDYPEVEGMLLLLDNSIYYEFMPMGELDSSAPRTLGIHEVELHTNYALVITTAGGLWRYLVGDTIAFVSKDPYRVIVTGRTKQHINTFGEELMVANTDKALAQVCQMTGAQVAEYSVAPVYMERGKSGYHQWAMEFTEAPTDLENFECLLDKELRKINSDYDAKRTDSLVLDQLRIARLSPGTFYGWMKEKGKYGGQNKVPRLSNTDKYIQELMKYRTA